MLPVQILLPVLLPGIFLWFFYRKAADGARLKKVFWPAVALKILSGFALGIYYNGSFDTFAYQKAANQLTDFAYANPGGYLKIIFLNDLSVFTGAANFPFKTFSNSFFLSKLLSLLNFITGSQYYLNSVFFSVFSFAGCWYLVRTLSLVFPGARNAAAFAFLFFPSVVVWSSGIQKEALMLGALGFFWATTLRLNYFPGKMSLAQLLLLLFSGWLLWKVRFFIAAVVFQLTGSWVLLRWLYNRFILFRKYSLVLAIIPVLCGALVLFLIQVTGVFDLPYLFKHLAWDYHNLLKVSLQKPHIEFSDFQPTLIRAVANAPEAIFSSFFRPFLFESSAPLYLFAGLENLFIAIIFLGAVFSLFKYGFKLPDQFFIVLAFYIILSAAIMALPTPNLGTLNRYRIAFLPFAIFLLLQTPFWQKAIEKIARKFR